MKASVNRRAFLRGMLLSTAAMAAQGCATTFVFNQDYNKVGRALIDAHAHVFNGADIPVYGFANRVLSLSPAISDAIAGLAKRAPSAASEIVILLAKLAAQEPPAQSDPPSEKDAQGSVAETAQGLLGAAAKDIPDEATPLWKEGHEAFEEYLGEVCDGGEFHFRNYSTIVRWGRTLMLSRELLMDRLHRVYGAGGTPQLLMPALVDFGLWLKDFNSTPMAQQIEVNALLSRLANRAPQNPKHPDLKPYAVHGYVPFDPWRDAMEVYAPPGWQPADIKNQIQRGPRPLDLVKIAIGEADETGPTRPGCGFLGVKLYPPMGFRAFGNASLPDTFFPLALRELAERAGRKPGALLDEHLGVLYDWCVEQDVPILTHSGPSNYPATDYQLRDGFEPYVGLDTPNPAHWERVLEKPQWRNLRLNLGHFGALIGHNCAVAKRAETWTETAARLCRYPNVYADASDITELFTEGLNNERDEIIERLARLLSPELRQKILYGSDWIMQARLRGHYDYLELMNQVFLPRLQEEAGANAPTSAEFFLDNAKRFINLHKGSRPFKRLEQFYGAWTNPFGGQHLCALDGSVLNPFLLDESAHDIRPDPACRTA